MRLADRSVFTFLKDWFTYLERKTGNNVIEHLISPEPPILPPPPPP